MASAAATGPASMTHSASGGGGGGPLSFMGCMREASPPPFDEPPPPQSMHHHHHHHHHHHRPVGLPTVGGELNQLPHGFDSMPKEPKKRRFHPLRGLRRIFRKKSRGAADSRLSGSGGERELNGEHVSRDHEEVTLRDPAGRAEEIRSRSASELLTESCDRDRLFLRRRGIEETFANNLRSAAPGPLSVSHDSVFPGEVPHTRPLSSLEIHESLERRVGNASEAEHKDSRTAQRHRISQRVVEQIKTVIDSRKQVAPAPTTTTTNAAAPTTTDNTNSLHSRLAGRGKSVRHEDTQAKVPRKDASTPTALTTSSPQKEDLPSLSAGGLNHTAALHRISVRPKNRRPPRRSNSGSLNTSGASNGLPRIDSITELEVVDALDSLETSNTSSTAEAASNQANDSPPSTPQQPQPSKPIPILRKSSSRLSRNSKVFEELEQKLPGLRKPAVSPDSLDSDSRSSSDAALLTSPAEAPSEELAARAPPRPMPRTGSAGSERSSPLASTPPRRRPSSGQRLSKSPDSLESGSPGWLTKSTEGLGFERLLEPGEAQQPATPTTPTSPTSPTGRPIAATRRLLLKPISKSQERVCCSKSSDSLEALEASRASDAEAGEATERRRGSFEMRPRQRVGQQQQQSTAPVHKLMSKSTECFDSGLLATERQLRVARADERARKRASVSEVNLSRGSPGRQQLSESFEKIAAGLAEPPAARREPERSTAPTTPTTPGPATPSPFWRPTSKRMAHSSESSDNLELEDNYRLENRGRARRSAPKRLSAGALLDEELVAAAAPPRKPSPRLQKSSESSELGSTDTLDSERRNTIKSSDSEETLDSLERELAEPVQPRSEEESPVQEGKDEEANDEPAPEEQRRAAAPYWARRGQENRESSNGLDIGQLLAYSLTSRVSQENGNEEPPAATTQIEEERLEEDKTAGRIRGSPLLAYPKKQQQQQSGFDDNKTLNSFSNMLADKTNDEDLQNMLNGNISEVSTKNKSFKEKLSMFENLAK